MLKKLDEKINRYIFENYPDFVEKVANKSNRHTRQIYTFDLYGDWHNMPWYERLDANKYVSHFIVEVIHMKYRCEFLHLYYLIEKIKEKLWLIIPAKLRSLHARVVYYKHTGEWV